MNKTKISYLTHTWNPTHGCSPVSEGCKFCWAKTMSKRLAGMGVKGYSRDEPFKVVCCPENLDEPLRIKKPSRIGVSFMGDLFHDVPDDFITRIAIAQTEAPQHDYLWLTKRPKRMAEYIKKHSVPKLAWLGVSVENQKTWDERSVILRKIRASILWISFEPLLENINMGDISWLTWAVIGTESGNNRRECKIEWIRDVVNQCKHAHVPVFVKQIQINGKVIKDINQFPDDLKVREYPK